MATSAAQCVPDRDWWIEEILDKQDLPPEATSDEELNCAAARYVDAMGVAEVIRRRILGAPLLAVPPDDEARIDLADQCHLDVRGTLQLLPIDRGACLAHFGSKTSLATVTSC